MRPMILIAVFISGIFVSGIVQAGLFRDDVGYLEGKVISKSDDPRQLSVGNGPEEAQTFNASGEDLSLINEGDKVLLIFKRDSRDITSLRKLD